jgi:Family of unknown function (DUF6463)
MSFTTTTGNLLIGTGTIHCAFGWMVPELRIPLIRSIQELSVVVPDINDHYSRECCFWFQIGGIMMIIQGLYIRSTTTTSHNNNNNVNPNPPQLPPSWFGWTLCGLGLSGIILMPVSGFWLILLQGIRLVVWTGVSNNKKNAKLL